MRLVKRLVQLLLILSLLLFVSSCLSTKAEIDIRSADDFVLDMTYEMPIGLWELGVFDENSSERAVPVSRRDAEETAALYDDVTLDTYQLTDTGEIAEIHVVYRSRSVESLRGLWGTVSGEQLTLDYSAGTVTIPLNKGTPETGIDREQRELITEVFAGEVFSIRVKTPAPISGVTFPEMEGHQVEGTDGSVFQWSAPMAELLLSDGPNRITIRWNR